MKQELHNNSGVVGETHVARQKKKKSRVEFESSCAEQEPQGI